MAVMAEDRSWFLAESDVPCWRNAPDGMKAKILGQSQINPAVGDSLRTRRQFPNCPFTRSTYPINRKAGGLSERLHFRHSGADVHKALS